MGRTVHPLEDQEIQVQQEPTRLAQRPAGDEWREEDPFERFFGRIRRPWSREPEEPPVFVRAELEPRRAVVGQQALYTVYLYTRQDIGAISPTVVPDFRGFWVRDVPLPNRLETDLVDVGGRRDRPVPPHPQARLPVTSVPWPWASGRAPSPWASPWPRRPCPPTCARS